MSATAPQSKKQWWITNKKVAKRLLKRARALLETQDSNEIQSALNLLEEALELCPKWDKALELKARALLYLKKFKEVAAMLQDYIPSLRLTDMVHSDSSPTGSREKVKLLNPGYVNEIDNTDSALSRCFSVTKLKERLFTGLSRHSEKEDQEWRFIVLGQACCHLGMLEDALVLLQSGKRVASAAFRRESTGQNDDDFPFENLQQNAPQESEAISHWLGTIKFLLRRKAAALAALDAGLYTEAARLFTKILEGRRGTPQGFIAECYMLRATAYQAAGRVADSIADCNRTLALDPTSIEALTTRASLFESVRCFSESLQDLEHVKLLYESILRHQRFPRPIWKLQNFSYRDISRNMEALNMKILAMKQRITSPSTIDYYALVGLSRGCSRADVERAHLLLCLRHRPDKASHFIERCEFVDERDIDSVKEQARLSALMLYRLLQKAYTFVMSSIMEDEAEKHRQLKATELRKEESVAPAKDLSNKSTTASKIHPESVDKRNEVDNLICVADEADKRDVDGEYHQVLLAVTSKTLWTTAQNATSVSSRPPTVVSKANKDLSDASAFQAVSCRDSAAVGTILSHGFPASVTYEALTC